MKTTMTVLERLRAATDDPKAQSWGDPQTDIGFAIAAMSDAVRESDGLRRDLIIDYLARCATEGTDK